MSNMQVAVADTNALCVGNKEVESESTEETTLTEVHKDLGHTQIKEKSAVFESNETTSVVEDTKTQQSESSKTVKQAESLEVSANRQDIQENNTISTAEVSTSVTSSSPYKPLVPIKYFEPLKPFEPIQPFEPLQPFETLKSVELANQVELTRGTGSSGGGELPKQFEPRSQLTGSIQPTELSKPENDIDGGLPEGYIPVKPLSPLKSFDINPPLISITSPANESSKAEIKEESIKNTLKEIISDLDTYVEKDKELKDGITEEKIMNGSPCSTLSQQGNPRGNDDSWVARLPSCLPVTPKLRPLSLPFDTFSDNFSQDENASPPKPINLEKIFTPADGEQIQPQKNRKMFASSAFYEKGFHPTVEDQVELAKRISNSLSDISNKSSKGQSMYVNRKKRSVKWVHEGEGRANVNAELNADGTEKSKDPLKLVMNPHGQIQDIYSLKKQGYNIEPALSPDVCLEIVKDLNSPKGKGAELFAKRRKRSEKWVVGETNGTRPTPIPDIAPSPTPLLSPLPPISSFAPPSYLPETAQRIQHKEKLDEIQKQFNRPRVKLIKSPWDAALETGSVDAAFEVEPVWPTKGNIVAPAVSSYEKALRDDSLESWTGANIDEPKMYAHNPAYNSSSINRIVDNLQKGVSTVDVYKPTLPQAWNASATPKQQQQYSSSTLPRAKPKAPLSPSYKPNVTPPVFIPKESTSPLPNLYAPAYNAQQSYSPQPAYQPPPQTQDDLYLSAEPSRKINYDNLHNYNTAPRGWGGSQNFYKPITFDKPKSLYSDF